MHRDANPTPVSKVSGTAAGPRLTLDRVSLAYPGGPPVLQHVTLAIGGGTITALIGPNGSGKSTLLNAIAGLLTPVSGTISIDGAPPARRRRQIAYVQQRTDDNRQLPISGREVVNMARYVHRGLLRPFGSADREAVGHALERMDATRLATRQLREMSGGQQQRVLIAQGLAQRGDVLLLDEPITGLDLTSREAILDVVRAERDDGTAVIMTTHDLADARAADHVVLLAGRVVAAGHPDDVLTAENLAKAYRRQPVLAGPRPVMDDPHHGH